MIRDDFSLAISCAIILMYDVKNTKIKIPMADAKAVLAELATAPPADCPLSLCVVVFKTGGVINFCKSSPDKLISAAVFSIEKLVKLAFSFVSETDSPSAEATNWNFVSPVSFRYASNFPLRKSALACFSVATDFTLASKPSVFFKYVVSAGWFTTPTTGVL